MKKNVVKYSPVNHVNAKGNEWSEYKVVIYIFELLKQ